MEGALVYVDDVLSFLHQVSHLNSYFHLVQQKSFHFLFFAMVPILWLAIADAVVMIELPESAMNNLHFWEAFLQQDLASL
jgi:hypothetical protein